MQAACLYSVQIDLCSPQLSSPLCDDFLHTIVRLFGFSIEIYSKLFLCSAVSSSDRSTVFRILGPLSVLRVVFTTELRRVLLILSVWRPLQNMQLITTQLPTVSSHGLPIDRIILLSTPVANTFIIFSSLTMDDDFQTMQKENCQHF